jgi:mannose/fructose/N-acetylgalactosamine-specific phosphotransferase system component IIC
MNEKTSLRSWSEAHPAGAAMGPGLTFGVLFGVIFSLSSRHSIGWDAVAAALLAVAFGLLMWVFGMARRQGHGAGRRRAG